MKNILLPIGVFTLAMMGTTTWSVMKTPLPEMPVDEVALADSLLADSLWRDSVATQHASVPVDEMEESVPEDVTEVALGTAASMPTEGQEAQTQVDVVEVPAAAPAQNIEAYQSLARIFARMKPAEAAEVLLHMSNEEIEGVVRNLGARQAASVLSNLPEQRAAELARLLLNPAPGGDR